MKILNEAPPNHKEIVERFPQAANYGIVFTYGDTLYSPTVKLDPDKVPANLIAHETMHTEQQGDDPAGWWVRYLTDDKFKLQQEVEAYRAQYYFAWDNDGKVFATNLLARIAKDLVDGYDLDITYPQAVKLIKDV